MGTEIYTSNSKHPMDNSINDNEGHIFNELVGLFNHAYSGQINLILASNSPEYIRYADSLC